MESVSERPINKILIVKSTGDVASVLLRPLETHFRHHTQRQFRLSVKTYEADRIALKTSSDWRHHFCSERPLRVEIALSVRPTR